MLTGDLVRASLRGGVVRPRWVDVDDGRAQREAARLIGIYEAAVGGAVGELDEAIADHIGDSTDYLTQRGLAKLLRDRATIEVRAAKPPEEIREVVFRLAAGDGWPVRPGGGGRFADRGAVIAAAAAALELSVDEVEAGLFADLKAAERLVDVELPEPRDLLMRYNLGLAQAVLLRASEVRVTLPKLSAKRARQLFAFIKFRRLMYRARRDGDTWTISLDGPLSLLRQTNRYGVQMAQLLPGLLLAERWSLDADVSWGKDRRPMRFELDHRLGLETHLADKGTWKSAEEVHFEKGFKAAKSDWRLRRSARVVDLGGRGVLVPDYLVKHPDGREALLEIVWFWRKRSFAKRLQLLREAGPPNLIVALATRYNTDRDAPDVGGAAVYPFKGVIRPKAVIALAEEVAT